MELEVQALIEEYRSLRAEIGQRVQNQLYIVGANIALVSAVLGLLAKDYALSFPNLTLILLAPQIFFAVGWLYFEQDVFLTQAAQYLHQHLRPAITRRIAEQTQRPEGDVAIMRWESVRNEVLFKKKRNRIFLRLMVTFRMVVTLGPGGALMVVGLRLMLAQTAASLSVLHYCLIVMDCIVFGLIIYQQNYVIRLYSEIAT